MVLLMFWVGLCCCFCFCRFGHADLVTDEINITTIISLSCWLRDATDLKRCRALLTDAMDFTTFISLSCWLSVEIDLSCWLVD